MLRYESNGGTKVKKSNVKSKYYVLGLAKQQFH